MNLLHFQKGSTGRFQEVLQLCGLHLAVDIDPLRRLILTSFKKKKGGHFSFEKGRKKNPDILSFSATAELEHISETKTS